MRVLVVDDSLLFRRFVHRLLEQKQDFQLVGEAPGGPEAVQKAKELQPDLILLDIGLPQLNGIEAAKQIRQIAPGTKTLFLTLNNDADVIGAALDTGAKGYVLKSDAGTELWPAIEAVLENKQYVSRGLASHCQTGVFQIIFN